MAHKTPRETPGDEKGRDQSDTGSGMPKSQTTAKRKFRNRFSLRSFRGMHAGPWVPELEKVKFCCLKPISSL